MCVFEHIHTIDVCDVGMPSDPQLRYAGFSLLTSLCFNLNVAVVILPDWESSSPFGLWGTCTDVFRDDKECGLVKQQV